MSYEPTNFNKYPRMCDTRQIFYLTSRDDIPIISIANVLKSRSTITQDRWNLFAANVRGLEHAFSPRRVIYWSHIHVTYVPCIFRSADTSIRIVRHHYTRPSDLSGSRIIAANCPEAFLRMYYRDRRICGKANWPVSF